MLDDFLDVDAHVKKMAKRARQEKSIPAKAPIKSTNIKKITTKTTPKKVRKYKSSLWSKFKTPLTIVGAVGIVGTGIYFANKKDRKSARKYGLESGTKIRRGSKEEKQMHKWIKERYS